MPRDKDLKRLVRTRMAKTGESYAAARAQVVRKAPAKKAAAPSTDFGKIAGMSDDAVKEKTGAAWDRWVKNLDRHGAAELTHAEITKLVRDEYGVGNWWAQMVTVGYERIKGLRARGQRRDGNYEATKSRTFNVDIETLFDAWHDAKTRSAWLDKRDLKMRTATRPKSIRFAWPGGGTIAVGFFAKGAGKAQVAFSQDKLPSSQAVEESKAFWTRQLDELEKLLAERA